ncbi:class I SAM-dependent methyltransferase [Streptomonospora nanhaiensis]|uniref:class I SAM-dependent methyltransferase n=1 Tax=Streptomonospora nanhaiensis TaxID=1323731 RepID=UPI001C392BD8|nr:class I SAM-dependent methyltransferase [Streptomonospora nanhaiensis]MBV2363882.1 class I SAM-dependent methyltransferase [Streptomonospora nanhaiensis]MBX9388251.1 class I SAM-dependent methyltransferase [Streptomonospora nanhaiensis]
MSDDVDPGAAERVARRPAGPDESARASRLWWERAADEYQAEHGGFLRDAGFVWGPEGLDEADAGLLGPPDRLRGARVLEIGCGAAQCSRWLRAQGVAEVVGIDVSHRQLQHARRIDEETGVRVPAVEADAQRLPFADASFDAVCSAYGGFPFVPDAAAALAEAARVLRPGGRLVFSVSHPLRWCFPDDPTERGLTAEHSYFDRRAYVEEDAAGRAVYVEHHRTVGDWVRAIAAAGLVLRDLVEPEWPAGHDRVWGGWSPLRGRLLPGTAVFCADRP